MSKVLILYYSKTGNTKKMAEVVARGVSNTGSQVDLYDVKDMDDAKSLIKYDGIIIGSPTYYGILATPIKQFLDDSIKIHGQLEGKIGGAFASCGLPGGGSETTNLSILQTMLVHGMVVQGFSKMGHYGPVCVDEPDERTQAECEQLGETVANLSKKLQ